MPDLYDNPTYYEIAFSFRDIPAEADVFEACFSRFSRVPVQSVLELGCGPSPHMEELAKRGYHYNGLDVSEAMLEYSRQKARQIGADASLFEGNMADFSLETPVDFVYIMLGSLCVSSSSELVKHFDSVAAVLRKGGLYLLDWCIQFRPSSGAGESWEIEKGGIRVKVTVSYHDLDLVEQTFEETIVLEVDDHTKRQTVCTRDRRRAIYPQEFLCLVRSRRDFEFVGWWNNWDLAQPLGETTEVQRPIALIRRI